MERRQLIISIVLMALATIAILEAVQLPFGTLRVPQSGFWPLILAIILALFSLLHFWKTVKEKVEKGNPFWTRPGAWKGIALVAGSLIAFGFLFDPLGYLISVFLLIAFLLRVIEPMKWWLVITIALLSSVLSYLMFGVLLSTPLPAGLLSI
jgi:putative tricarboxylic transport membrane protein